MKKEYISFGLIGIVAGLVIGFFVGRNLLRRSSQPEPVSGIES